MSDQNINELITNNHNQYEFKLQQYLKRGFEICNQFVIGFILFFLLLMLITGAIDLLSGLGDVVNRIFVTPVLGVGVYFVARNISRKDEFNFDQFWKGFQFISPLIMMSLIEAAIFLLLISPILVSGDISLYLEWYEEWQKTPLSIDSFPGFQTWYLFLLLPIVYLSIVWIYAPLLIIFYDMPAWDAMETSRKIISKQWGIFALFYFLVSIISVSGILFFSIGILYTLPIGACILYASFEDILDFYLKDEKGEDDIMDHLIDAFR
ncbi:MAG: hypothetical protein AB8H03_12350 [Saprospiraceae bacterium]